MKKYLFILLLAAGCAKEKQVKPKKAMDGCNKCVCSPSLCPVGTAD